jgi:hypothetical protein
MMVKLVGNRVFQNLIKSHKNQKFDEFDFL